MRLPRHSFPFRIVRDGAAPVTVLSATTVNSELPRRANSRSPGCSTRYRVAAHRR